MTIAAYIPVRLQSSRLPQKAILKIGNKAMIEHVYENTLKSKAPKLISELDTPIIKIARDLNQRSVEEIIFSDENLDKFNAYTTKLEKNYKPKVDKVVNKIKSKKKIKKDYLIPISMIISATIIALAILFQ